MNVPVKQSPGEIMESVLIKGDLSKLTPQERAEYYTAACRSLGLNPLTKPFLYIVLNGQLTLYAAKGCTDQLRRLNGISMEIEHQGMADGMYSVHVRATDKAGRVDEDVGVVALPDTTKGEMRANLLMKAITKAKRRATLSISGLGFLDETEVEDIPQRAKRPADQFNDEIPAFAGQVVEEAKQDADAGEPGDSPPTTHKSPPASALIAAERPLIQSTEAIMAIEDMAREAAMRGEPIFQAFYKARTAKEKEAINKIGAELREIMANAG